MRASARWAEIQMFNRKIDLHEYARKKTLIHSKYYMNTV